MEYDTIKDIKCVNMDCCIILLFLILCCNCNNCCRNDCFRVTRKDGCKNDSCSQGSCGNRPNDSCSCNHTTSYSTSKKRMDVPDFLREPRVGRERNDYRDRDCEHDHDHDVDSCGCDKD